MLHSKKNSPTAPQRAGDKSAAKLPLICGGLTAIIILALGLGWLFKIEQPAHIAEQATRLSLLEAEQAAASLAGAINQFQQRLDTTVAALDPTDIRREGGTEYLEQRLLESFPEAVALRLWPLSVLQATNYSLERLALRNHIEVDLLRRASNTAEPTIESYNYQGQWLTSLAQQIRLPGVEALPAIALLTFPSSALQPFIPPADQGGGRYELQQHFTDSRGAEQLRNIVTSGEATADTLTSTATVKGAPWQVRYTPGPNVLAAIEPDLNPYYLVAGLTLLGGLLSAFIAPRLANQAPRLQRPRWGKSAAADAGTPTTQEDEPETPEQAAPIQERGLLYQDHDIVQEHDLEDGLDLDLTLDGEEEEAFPHHIFRAYDIRGDADRELTDELVRRIAVALAAELQFRGESELVLASDGRLSSPRIRSQLIAALLESGLSVIDIGIVPTPLVYFATHELGIPSAVMVTGSHNPAPDNGMKIVIGGRTIGAGGIDDLRQRALANRGPEAGFQRGRLSDRDLSAEYFARIASDIAIPAPLKLVIDAGNGATGELAPLLFRELNCDVTPLNCDIDGHFPNHPPDTSNEANLAELVTAVVSRGADLGIAFDGDGDRVAVVTGSGQIVRADELLMLLASDVVARNPGADVVFDVKCSRHLARLVTELGGRPIMWKTGHAFMKEKMAETGALLGGEFSGHIFFGERWYGHDDGLYAAARIAELCATQDASLDELLADLPRSVSTPELRIAVAEDEKFGLIERLTSECDFGAGKLTTLDGLRVDFHAGWGLLRASNTEAALTARFEGDTPEQLEEIMAIFRTQLARVAPALNNAF